MLEEVWRWKKPRVRSEARRLGLGGGFSDVELARQAIFERLQAQQQQQQQQKQAQRALEQQERQAEEEKEGKGKEKEEDAEFLVFSHDHSSESPAYRLPPDVWWLLFDLVSECDVGRFLLLSRWTNALATRYLERKARALFGEHGTSASMMLAYCEVRDYCELKPNIKRDCFLLPPSLARCVTDAKSLFRCVLTRHGSWDAYRSQPVKYYPPELVRKRQEGSF